ncbi:hypothetical protein BGZ46_008947, partial [Entomortierella lignicola]
RMTFNKWARPESQALLATKIHTVRSISTVFHDTYRLLIQLTPPLFHNVAELRCRYLPVSRPNLEKNRFYLPYALSLIERCPNLQVLELNFFNFERIDYVQRLLSAIRRLGPRLHQLLLTFDYRDYKCNRCQHLYWILWSCAAVQYLKLDFRLKELGLYDEKVDVPELWAMAKEALHGNSSFDLEAQSHSESKEISCGSTLKSPALNFAWREVQLPRDVFYYKAGATTLQEAISVISTASLPRLKHLNLTYHTRDDNLALLSSCINLKSVSLPLLVRSQVWTDLLLSKSGHSLEELGLVGRGTFQSKDILRILTCCPNLRKFEALGRADTIFTRPNRSREAWDDPVLSIKDFQLPEFKDKDWVCHNLEVLRICYLNSGKYIPPCLYEQIAKFEKLKDLRLECICPFVIRENKCGVQDALKKWVTLKDLRTLELRGLGSVVDRKQLTVVRKQWTKLEWVQYS